MPWMPGIPRDEDAPEHGTDSTPPIAVVLHRTIGHWAGDYSVIKAGGLAHFLVGEYDNQVVQFADTDNFEWHAGGANDWSVGIEFSGMNGDALTPWQITKGGEIIRWLAATYSIPFVYNDGTGGRNGPVNAFVAHNYVSEPEDQHTDRINRDDWDTMVSGHQSPPIPRPRVGGDDDDMMFVKNPHNPVEVWCLAGNTRRHVTQSEWKMRTGPYGGNPYVNQPGTDLPGGPWHALTIDAEWFDSYPVAA